MKKNILHRALSASAIVAGTDEYWEWNGVEVPPNNTYWYKTVSGEMLSVSKITNITSHTYENGKGVIVVSGTPSLPSSTFENNTNLLCFLTPENISAIGEACFRSCTMLEDVYVGKSASISNYAFSYCQNMKRFVVSSKNSSHDSRNNCNGLIRKRSNGLVFGWGCTTKIPEGVTQTHGGAYLGITTIKSVEFPTTLTKIGGDTFKNCTNLKELRFNRTTAPTVDSGAFTNVSSGGKLYCPTGSTGYSSIKPSGWSIVYF